MPSFKCKDLGMQDSFEIKDENQEELIKLAAMHAEKAHGLKGTPENLEAIKKAIKK